MRPVAKLMWAALAAWVMVAVSAVAVVAADRPCGTVAGAKWNVEPAAGNTWVVFTNMPSCATALDLVPQLTNRSVVDLAEAGRFRCAPSAVRGSGVLGGICYDGGPGAGHFTWGARTVGYDRPAACAVCSGVPGEPHAALPVATAGPAP